MRSLFGSPVCPNQYRALLSTYRHSRVAPGTLGKVATEELHKELLRDDGDGMNSIPPEVPAGWQLTHQLGTRWLTMKKIENRRDAAAMPSSSTTMKYNSLNSSRSVKPNPLKMGGSPPNVEIQIPFCTHDPSLYDNTIDACEWQPFDVICAKGSTSTSAVMFRLAAVNSQLRVRGIQMLTSGVARAVGSPNGSIGIFGGYGLATDYRRTLAYNGPLFSSLGTELQACVLDYVAHDIGIDDLMLEFILQSAYLSENAEYQKWLHDLTVFASE